MMATSGRERQAAYISRLKVAAADGIAAVNRLAKLEVENATLRQQLPQKTVPAALALPSGRVPPVTATSIEVFPTPKPRRGRHKS
jgi:hypothetical protein